MQCGDPQRLEARLEQALARSNWQFSVRDPNGVLVGFVRATSDLALNANLWDLSADPGDPAQAQVAGDRPCRHGTPAPGIARLQHFGGGPERGPRRP